MRLSEEGLTETTTRKSWVYDPKAGDKGRFLSQVVSISHPTPGISLVGTDEELAAFTDAVNEARLWKNSLAAGATDSDDFEVKDSGIQIRTQSGRVVAWVTVTSSGS